MTTSNPNVIPPAGGGEPDPDRSDVAGGHDTGPDPLLADRLEGAVPTPQDPETPEAPADGRSESVEGDRAAGAD